MRRIFSKRNITVLSGLASGMFCLNLINHSIKIKLDKDNQDTLANQNGYDFFLKEAKNIKQEEQRKLLFDLKSREQHIKELKDPSKKFDIVVIGGGCNGAGVIFDASSRGLYCALIDGGDFASGTSSRSTKIIHGGIGYLEQLFKLERGFIDKIKLLKEGLDERNFMLNTAPYLNKKLEMVIPCDNIFKLIYYYIGTSVYHTISYINYLCSDYQYHLSRPTILSKTKMKELFPLFKNSTYGIKFAEGQMNDTRLAIQTLMTSTVDFYIPGMKGAVLGNYIECIGLVKDSNGKIEGVKLRDKFDGKEFSVKASTVVNCAGIFSDAIRLMDNPSEKRRMAGSRGVHIMLPHKFTQSNVGVVIPKTAEGKTMFILPTQGVTIAGPTDHRCNIQQFPQSPESDINEIVHEVQNYFSGDIEKEIVASWWGIRPLVIEKTINKTRIENIFGMLKNRYYKLRGREFVEKNTNEAVARSHVLEVSNSGLISLMGGKWTAYRKMGKDTVDLILKEHSELKPSNSLSISNKIRMIGAYTNKLLNGKEKSISEFIPHYAKFLHENYKLDIDSCNHLIECYGASSIQVAELGKELKLNEKLNNNLPALKVQVIYAVRKELAIAVKDVIFRRLGVGFTNTKIAEEMIPIVAQIMGRELNWTKEKQVEEIESAKMFLKRLG